MDELDPWRASRDALGERLAIDSAARAVGWDLSTRIAVWLDTTCSSCTSAATPTSGMIFVVGGGETLSVEVRVEPHV